VLLAGVYFNRDANNELDGRCQQRTIDTRVQTRCLDDCIGCLHCVNFSCFFSCSLTLAPVKSRLVLPLWYRLTQVVLEKRPTNGCSCSSISQVIGCEDRLRNDLYCVEWGVKLYSNQPILLVCRFLAVFCGCLC